MKYYNNKVLALYSDNYKTALYGVVKWEHIYPYMENKITSLKSSNFNELGSLLLYGVTLN